MIMRTKLQTLPSPCRAWDRATALYLFWGSLENARPEYDATTVVAVVQHWSWWLSPGSRESIFWNVCYSAFSQQGPEFSFLFLVARSLAQAGSVFDSSCSKSCSPVWYTYDIALKRQISFCTCSVLSGYTMIMLRNNRVPPCSGRWSLGLI